MNDIVSCIILMIFALASPPYYEAAYATYNLKIKIM